MPIYKAKVALHSIATACKKTADSAESMEQRNTWHYGVGITAYIKPLRFHTYICADTRTDKSTVKHHSAENIHSIERKHFKAAKNSVEVGKHKIQLFVLSNCKYDMCHNKTAYSAHNTDYHIAITLNIFAPFHSNKLYNKKAGKYAESCHKAVVWQFNAECFSCRKHIISPNNKAV